MPRFFVPSDNIRYEGDKATAAEITGTDVNHIKNVLRAGIGKCILLCDSRGNEYTCIISDISQDRIVADVTEIRKACAEPVVPVLLLQGVPKGDKMDFIVQKGVELGAKAFLPVSAERTVVRLGSDADREKKRTRWQRISLEAAKQCGRGTVPEVLLPTAFREALVLSKAPPYDKYLKLIPYENESDVSVKDVLQNSKSKFIGFGDECEPDSAYTGICVFIGPEGGFSREEVALAASAGFIPVTLGKRILRTETAGLTVMASIRYEFDD